MDIQRENQQHQYPKVVRKEEKNDSMMESTLE
jgi:hypothetical protein